VEAVAMSQAPEKLFSIDLCSFTLLRFVLARIGQTAIVKILSGCSYFSVASFFFLKVEILNFFK